MAREDYIQQIRERSGYCGCPKLSDLVRTIKIAEGLEATCDFLERNVDLKNPGLDDKKFLQGYEKKAIDLEKSVKNYHEQLEKGVRNESLSLILYSGETETTIGRITLREANSLPEEIVDPIITINCERCNQQIDLWKY